MRDCRCSQSARGQLGHCKRGAGFCDVGSTWSPLAEQRGLHTPEILLLPKKHVWDMCVRKLNKTLPCQPSLFGAREGWEQSRGTAGACAHRRCSHPGVPSWESWGLPHWPWDALHLSAALLHPHGAGARRQLHALQAELRSLCCHKIKC